MCHNLKSRPSLLVEMPIQAIGVHFAHGIAPMPLVAPKVVSTFSCKQVPSWQFFVDVTLWK